MNIKFFKPIITEGGITAISCLGQLGAQAIVNSLHLNQPTSQTNNQNNTPQSPQPKISVKK